MEDKGRRNFIAWGFGGFATVGALVSLIPMKKAWDPLPSVLSKSFVTINMAKLKVGDLKIIKWRGKPIFVMKKPSIMPIDDERDVKIGNDRFLVFIGLCTHLGCIPPYNKNNFRFECPCHGGIFDFSGRAIFGPPPSPLVIPPFAIKNNNIILGKIGPEYKKMLIAQGQEFNYGRV